jgi:hypothetical protein
MVHTSLATSNGAQIVSHLQWCNSVDIADLYLCQHTPTLAEQASRVQQQHTQRKAYPVHLPSQSKPLGYNDTHIKGYITLRYWYEHRAPNIRYPDFLIWYFRRMLLSPK